MAAGGFRFDDFLLDPANRRLLRGGEVVELNARYLDALALLVREAGALVSKDRFMEEVWRGVPVTDEALTQCIRTLRRQLGDDAKSPRFIETAPKHGYRFVAPVERVESGAPAAAAATLARPRDWSGFFSLGLAGAVGGGVAGGFGGLFYGFGASAGMGAVSVLLVLMCVNVGVGLVGGAGVGFGVAAARMAVGHASPWSIVGGAFGGLVVGALVKLIGLDAFSLLFGHSPGDITGAGEGALLGAAVGLGAWVGLTGASLRWGLIAGGVAGAAAGLLIALMGRSLMGGSLDLLARQFPGSRLELGQIAALFGEDSFGHVTRLATSAIEGLIFCAVVVGAIVLARGRK